MACKKIISFDTTFMDVFRKKYFPGLLLIVSSTLFFFGWLRIAMLMEGTVESSWTVPIALFSSGISLLGLVFLLHKPLWLRLCAIAVAFIPSLFFIHSVLHGVILCLTSGICFYGFSRMHTDMLHHTRIMIRNSMHHGIGFVVVSFSLCIASLYYAQMQTESNEKLLERLSLNQTSHGIINQSLGILNPEFKQVTDRGVTVDEFLETIQDMQLPEGSILKTPSDEELLRMAGVAPDDPSAPLVLKRIRVSLEKNASTLNSKEVLLQQGRKQLSDSVGRTVQGQDPIADVLSDIIDQRLRTYFQPNIANGNESILPFILSVILFITLWSLGSILSIVWRYLTAMLFHIFRSFGWIVIQKVTTEQEVVA